MAINGTWMSQIELRAAAITFGVNIFVFNEDAEIPFWTHYSPTKIWPKNP